MTDEVIGTLIARLEKVTARLEQLEKQVGQSGGGAAPAAPGGSSAFVAEYEDLINQHIKPFVDCSNKIGDKVVAEQANLVLEAVQKQLEFLKIVAASKKPNDQVFQKLLQPTSDLMGKITTLADKNRGNKFKDNLFAVSEGIGALGWVCVSPAPAPYIAEMKGGSELYSNRLLKEYKEKDQNQVQWIGAYNGFLKDLQLYVKKNHTTGLSWNPKGGDASAAPSSQAPSSQAPPPPGPPGPPPPPVLEASSSSSGAPDMSAVFSALNKGTDVTSGLKKVTSDMKTKNRTDKPSVVPSEAPKKTTTTTATSKAPATVKPPKFALEGNRWVIEHQINNREILIEKVEAKHTVYIFGCKGSVVQIKGKVNAISVDNCEKTGVIFEQAISSFEVVNSNSVEVQVNGKVPSIAIDKTSGCQIYLSEQSLDVEIVSSKSSEMNVMIPGPNKEMIELSIPEQYKTSIKNNKLITESTAHI